MPSPYNYHWRAHLRPETLARDCHECVRCGMQDRPMGLWSVLDIAHLDGDPTNNAEENRATLCRKCHRGNDYESWAEKRRVWLTEERERRIDAKDAARPIFAVLQASVEVGCHE